MNLAKSTNVENIASDKRYEMERPGSVKRGLTNDHITLRTVEERFIDIVGQDTCFESSIGEKVFLHKESVTVMLDVVQQEKAPAINKQLWLIAVLFPCTIHQQSPTKW